MKKHYGLYEILESKEDKFKNMNLEEIHDNIINMEKIIDLSVEDFCDYFHITKDFMQYTYIELFKLIEQYKEEYKKRKIIHNIDKF